MENNKISPKWIIDLSIKDLESTPKDDLLNYLEILDEALVFIKYNIIKHNNHALILLNENRKLKVKKTRKQIKRILKNNKEEVREIQHPFKDDETYQLFNFIVEKWEYDKDQKWADIWNALHFSDIYIAPYKNDYKAYVIRRFQYTGKFQFDKLKKDNNRHKMCLDKLVNSFSEK